MTLEWLPLDALEPHPENSNRMPPHLMEKLKSHIQRTGLYEPLVVRPLERGTRNAERGAKTEGSDGGGALSSVPSSEFRAPRFQILNGHHRAEVLRQLGHSQARCDVWDVDDAEALVLLATLNRLEGRDNPRARARLVAHLVESRPAGALADLLPEPPDAVERLLTMARPPASPLSPDQVAPRLAPMTFFLSDDQRTAVTEALAEIQKRGTRNSASPLLAPHVNGGPRACDPRLTSGASNIDLPAPSSNRSAALAYLALWYLESQNIR
jgi:hypothetical protein